ncbi:MAG TPA: 50S ribosomal protein L13 [Bacillota bacterium]
MGTTFVAKPGSVQRKWYVVDAAGKPLGRLAARVAAILRGKHKPEFTPHVDTGDFVIVVNADKVKLTGNKLDRKVYYRHTGHPGGLKRMTARQLLNKHPERVIQRAVRGMLPSGPLARRQFRKLRVYAGPNHPHQAQQPEPLQLDA